MDRPFRAGGRTCLYAAQLLAALLHAALLQVESARAEDAPPRPDFERLRQDEDWSALCEPRHRERWWDALKCISLDGSSAARLSLGGELRQRYEYTRNPSWGDPGLPRDEAFLQRYVVHADLHAAPGFRAFAQLYGALESGRAGDPSPIDENRFDLQQLFVDLPLSSGATTSSALRVGRQELRYGSARLVDVREGPNVRRKFDGLRLEVGRGAWRMDAIAVHPADIEPGVFDDGTDRSQALWGIYAAARDPAWLRPGVSLDLYYLGYEHDAARYEQGVARERRHTFGTRIAGEHAAWDWNWEVMFQGGSFGEGRIRAWSLATDTGYTWSNARGSPRVGLSANVASGDRDPRDADLESFNALFPRGNYFSELALLGPRNFFNVHPFVTVRPTERLSLTADVDFFWRLEKGDGLYGPGGALLLAGAASGERYVGAEFSANATWQLNPSLGLTVIYARFFPGAFVETTGPGATIDFVEVTLKAQL
jgi:hypothetical protein